MARGGSRKSGRKGGNEVLYGQSPLTEYDIHLFREGSHFRLYEKMGARLSDQHGSPGTHFAVWAPNAAAVSVIGGFNKWKPGSHSLRVREDGSGIWEGFIPGVGKGELYKYQITSLKDGYKVAKADPFGLAHQVPPDTASVVWDLPGEWDDGVWMKRRGGAHGMDAPISIYEMHLGSWRREPDRGGFLNYRELAPVLSEYLLETGFTHVELLPVMEHPLYRSWGYQTLGYFAPTSRYGTPQDFAFFVDHLHKHGLGVILDWVPSHFPSDEHGLAYFDGTHLFEHADPRQGFHPDWKSLIFNYGRNEVRNFLTSSAAFWLDVFHADGLRVDAVASMLYLDYSRRDGDWVPNQYGGRENVDAIEFVKRLNHEVYSKHPDVLMIAEESTAWPMVTMPTYLGGLGFGLKWDMGWMHDTLKYFSQDPVHRKHHHNALTFRSLYSHTENYVLSLSHDEVVHGKRSLLNKMPGDDWQRFANLRALYGYMFALQGKKMLFMGSEFGQWNEWYEEEGLDWPALYNPLNGGLKTWVKDLNRLYKTEPALHTTDCSKEGFQWVDCNDADQSVLSLVRTAAGSPDMVLAVFNLTPLPRHDYRLGVPGEGFWKELLNSDAGFYGGSNMGNGGGVWTVPWTSHQHPNSVFLTLPPLSASFFKHLGDVQ